MSLADTVYERIREAIENLALPPGTHLQEVELASQYGVSRTPIREALRRLAADGLVELAHGRGATVAHGNLRDIVDAYEVRKVLEPVAAAQAAQRAKDDPRLAGLERELATLSGAPATDLDVRERERLDRELHGLIAELSGNQILARIIRDLHSRVQRVYVQLGSGGRFERIQEEHLRVLAAVRGGDPDAAREAMAAHLEANSLIVSGGTHR